MSRGVYLILLYCSLSHQVFSCASVDGFPVIFVFSLFSWDVRKMQKCTILVPLSRRRDELPEPVHILPKCKPLFHPPGVTYQVTFSTCIDRGGRWASEARSSLTILCCFSDFVYGTFATRNLIPYRARYSLLDYSANSFYRTLLFCHLAF